MATTTTSTDRIERQVVLEAPRSRVWRALTDVSQFNTWFGVQLTRPFEPGAEVSGKLSYKGQDFSMTIWIDRMEPERYFSFRWHPYAIDPDFDYSGEPKTVVGFTLEDAPGGTKLTIVESGFDAIPASRRATAFEMNGKGWTAQVDNLRRYLAANA